MNKFIKYKKIILSKFQQTNWIDFVFGEGASPVKSSKARLQSKFHGTNPYTVLQLLNALKKDARELREMYKRQITSVKVETEIESVTPSQLFDTLKQEAETDIDDAKDAVGRKAFKEANDDLKGAYQKFRDIAEKAKGIE